MLSARQAWLVELNTRPKTPLIKEFGRSTMGLWLHLTKLNSTGAAEQKCQPITLMIWWPTILYGHAQFDSVWQKRKSQIVCPSQSLGQPSSWPSRLLAQQCCEDISCQGASRLSWVRSFLDQPDGWPTKKLSTTVWLCADIENIWFLDLF